MAYILTVATSKSVTTSRRKTESRWQKSHAASLFLSFCLLTLAAPAGSQETQPVAMLDGKPISAQELSNTASGQLLPVRNQEYEIQSKALEKLIRQKLLELAAKKKGESTEALLSEEVDRKVADPSDAEVLAYYLAQKDRNRQSFAQVKNQLREALKREEIQYARDAYLDRLRSQADVVVLLKPPRAKVTYDAARLKGNPRAPVVIVEFADFQCPFCRQEEGALKNVLAKYGTEVALAYRDFPVTQLHPLAEQAAEASRCGGEQGKYWQFYDLLMAGALDSRSLKQYAHDLKLDEKQFDSCLTSGKYKAAIENDRQDAERVGVVGTPTFFINGILMVGAEPEESVSRRIDQELARQKAAPSPVPGTAPPVD
jgi:protein-disulfide isomerase